MSVAPPFAGLAAASPEVTQWPQRLLLTAVMVVVVALAVYGMWRGWRNRAARQADVPELPSVPDATGPVLASAEGRYVGTVRAGDWLDRIVARGLGAPGRAQVEVSAAGVLFDRDGAPEIFIPASMLTAVNSGKGVAGDVVEREGFAVVSWQLGEVALDTAFRADRAADQRAVMQAAAALVAQPTGGTA
ncbi:MAG: hypothetical protein QG597_1793 [Actinomycetota bacterium]|nr:hypothetical protein [Actinomycetota bacterium]